MKRLAITAALVGAMVTLPTTGQAQTINFGFNNPSVQNHALNPAVLTHSSVQRMIRQNQTQALRMNRQQQARLQAQLNRNAVYQSIDPRVNHGLGAYAPSLGYSIYSQGLPSSLGLMMDPWGAPVMHCQTGIGTIGRPPVILSPYGTRVNRPMGISIQTPRFSISFAR